MANVSYRPLQMAGLLKREITMLMRSKINDARLNCLSVTDVEVSRNCSHARVYILIPSHEDEKQMLKVVTAAGGFIRSHLSSKLALRFIPKLSFKIDNSYQHGNRIEQILKEIHR